MTVAAQQSDFVLNPSARVLWRGPDIVQLELGGRAVVLDGVDAELIASLVTPVPDPPPAASGNVCPLVAAGPAAARRAGDRFAPRTLAALSADGFLTRRPDPTVTPPVPQLAAEVAALRTRHGSRAEEVLGERADALVQVYGTGQLPVAIAALLAAANVGRVHLPDRGDVHRHDAAPGGLRPSDEGRRFSEAAHDALLRAAPTVDTRAPAERDRPDLVVLAGSAPVDPRLRESLHIRGIAHLLARTEGDAAIVGPLVLPGLTSCLGCADLIRLDRDPAWTVLAVQLSNPRRHAEPTDFALTSLTASLAALHALAYLDGEEPPTLSASVELRLPDWRLRRRTWPRHPCCGCTTEKPVDEFTGDPLTGTGHATVGDTGRLYWAQ